MYEHDQKLNCCVCQKPYTLRLSSLNRFYACLVPKKVFEASICAKSDKRGSVILNVASGQQMCKPA